MSDGWIYKKTTEDISSFDAASDLLIILKRLNIRTAIKGLEEYWIDFRSDYYCSDCGNSYGDCDCVYDDGPDYYADDWLDGPPKMAENEPLEGEEV